ncbi:MAG: endonuclease/exonuclease/phosphatase family protein [Rhodospirillales bacterium]
MTHELAMGVGAVFLAATLIPAIRSGAWYIRMFDYPRLQVALGLAAALAAFTATMDLGAWTDWALTAAMVAALVHLATLIVPYTPLVRRPVIAVREPGGERVRVLIANVRVGTRDAAPFLRAVDAADPDIILTAETDDWWDRALEPLAARYPHAVRLPKDDGFGMHFFTRLPAVDGAIEHRCLVETGVPSVRARLRLSGGGEMLFYGLHPQPPLPFFEPTEPRDAELLLVGREAKRLGLPAIVAGDLNDVAWSATTRLFMRSSGLLDPRIGRGMYATFPAALPGLRWPLDHIFHTVHFGLADLRLLPSIGSDHLPVLVELRRHVRAETAQEPTPPAPGDRAEVRETIRAGLAKAD